ncbi:hypothetical protein O1R50_19315 [Glycomyces luteolus]|uniref:Uncharacterized protein n=1 Tax=Glycomyces luteolus TaxID=2670330 RepID=A0A9X3PCR8_9ACTN|nr:hypothetical protein [Glycomyces luteolus]MDA1361786.1 hypothetical protein [Glycomyces luteolus]
MRIPARPPEVGQAVAVLWTVAIAFAAAFTLKLAGLGTFHEEGRAAQYRAARIEGTDPDLLESVPILLEIGAFLASLNYGLAAFLFICAARSVGIGARRSFTLTVSASIWAALGCLGQPALWLRMHTAGRESTVDILDRILETLPWWVPAADVLAAAALLAALVALAMLRDDNALWFRGARPRNS